MAYSSVRYTSTGGQTYNVPFPYLEAAHVKVYINGVETSAFTWSDAATIHLNVAPAVGATILIKRETPRDGMDYTFSAQPRLKGDDLDDAFKQTYYVGLEALDKADSLDAVVSDAQAAQAAAEGARDTALVAQGAAKDAKDAAVVAQGLAEYAADLAATYANNAGAGTYAEVSSAPTTDANEVKLYAKDVTGVTELFIRKESNGTEVQVTSGTGLSVTPTADATESVAGKAELATQAETDAGTDDARIVTPKKLYSTPGIYRRNAIINGAMEIAQRGTSFPSAATGQFIVDRFQYVKSGTSAVHTVGQSSDAPTGVGLSNSALLDCTTADTSIDATDYSGILYFVEGYDFARFKDRQAVLSFYVKAPKAGAYCVSFMNSGNDRSYVAEYTVNQPNAWEFKSIPITFNYTGGTWNYTNGRGVGIYWMVACGSTYHTTPGAWQTGIFLATANQVNGLDSTDNDFYITGVQLEKGSVATDFEFRSFATELALCQRYYQVVGGVPGSGPRFAGNAAATWVHTYHLPVTMRAAPTAVKNGTWYVYNCSSPLVSGPSPNCFVLSTTASTPGAFEYRPDSSDDTITLSAEV